ncbi:hypothetical protein BSK55_29170, partial [Paenibacillus odorifer]
LAPFNVSAATLILYHVRLFNVKLFFNFFFELGMCTSWPDLEYIMYGDTLQEFFYIKSKA